MPKKGPLFKGAAVSLCAALILLSPGIGAYSAVAGELAAEAPARLPDAGPQAVRVDALPQLGVQAIPSTLSGSQAVEQAVSPAAAAGVAAEAAAAATAALSSPLGGAPVTTPARARSLSARIVSLVAATVAPWQARETSAVAEPALAGASSSALPRPSPKLSTDHARVHSRWITPKAAFSDRVAPASRLPAAVNIAFGAVVGAAALVLAAEISPLLALVAGATGSILLHEAAHLWALRALGDRTAAKHGIRSAWDLLDWRWTAALPAATAAFSALAAHVLPVFPVLLAGWAKPLPVDFNELSGNKRVSAGLASLAGPAMNAALMAGLAGAAWLLPLPLTAAAAFLTLAKINAGLALFNLLPLPHLDGGKALVALMPQSWYARWLHNDQVPQDYQPLFQHLYEGPSALLNFLSMTSQKKVNLLAAGITVGLFGAATLMGWWFFQAPLVMMMLVCSYDYYCIREKVQNEEATRAIQGNILSFASAIAEMAENDPSIESEIDPEQVEHSLKNAFENTMDAVVDSEGFEALTNAERWQRLEAAYLDAAVAELKRAGMSKDTPEKIRAVLESAAGQAYRAQLQAWLEKYDVFKKWHSPGRKAAKARAQQQGQESAEQKTSAIGSATKAVIALAVVGGAALMTMAGSPAGGTMLASAGVGAMMAGTLAPQAPPKPKTFFDALNDNASKLKLDGGKIQKLTKLLKEKKFETKPPVIGRDEEMHRVVNSASAPRGDINSVMLIGEAGVGKTAIVEKLAQAMLLSDEEPESGTFKLKRMDGRYLVELDASALMSGDEPLKDLKLVLETIERMNDADKKTGSKVVLFIDEVHKLFVGANADQMAAALLTPLRDGELTVIAATTRARYKALIEKHDDFKRRLAPIWVEPSSDEQTLRALEGRQDHYEEQNDVVLEPETLESAVKDSVHDHELYQPGRSFKYVLAAMREAKFEARRENAASRIKTKIEELQYQTSKLARRLSRTARVKEDLENGEPKTISIYNAVVDLTHELVALYRERAAIPTSGKPVVAAEDVQKQISLETGVPMSQFSVTSKLAEKFLNFEKAVSKRVIGQAEAVRALGNALKRMAAGLSDPTKPLGVFYLNGPTGSGKTHLARETARYLFDDPDAMIRIDMSEYMEKHTVAQLKGAPPGYVGYDVGGQLTEQVRRHPYSVILLDEIEKAHPDVWMILLQIMGSARLTDGQGKTVDFSKTLIMMTSNLGMQGLDLDAYVQRFAGLQQQKAKALEAGDKATADMLDKQLYALAADLADKSKKQADEATVAAFKNYPPEFRGRLSYAPIIMNRVTPEMAVDIAELNIGELAESLARAGHVLEWDHRSKELDKLIVNEGYDVELGARPIQNAIDRLLKDPIADKILTTALENGGKVGPMRIFASVEKGRVKLDIEPIVPKPVEKKTADQGAAQEVFGRVVGKALEAAARQAKATLGLKEVDQWLSGARLAAPPAVPASQPAPTQPAQAAPSVPAEPSPAVSQSFTASHYEAEGKDPQLLAANRALKQTLEVQGYAPDVVEALTRRVQQPNDPFVGWVKEMAAHAKKATPAALHGRPLELTFEIGDAARVVLRRPGTLSEDEDAALRDHFSGTVPQTSTEARDRGEQLQVLERPEGRRLYFELYRKLSAIPGAKLGWTQTDRGVEYWIEVPKGGPASPPPAAANGEQVGTAPQAEQPSASEAAPAAPRAEKITLDPAVSDRQLAVSFERTDIAAVEEAVARLAPRHHSVLRLSYARSAIIAIYRDADEARQAAAGFAAHYGVVAVTLGTKPGPSATQEWRELLLSKLKAAAPGAVKPNTVRVELRKGGTDVSSARNLLEWTGFSKATFNPLGSLLVTNVSFKDPATDVASVASLVRDLSVASITLDQELLDRVLASPPPPHPSAPIRHRVATSETMAKLETAAPAEAGADARTIRVDFAADDASQFISIYNYVKPALQRDGLEYVGSEVLPGAIRVEARAVSVRDAGERAYRLAEDRLVRKVVVHPDAAPFFAARPGRALPEELEPVKAPPRSGARGAALEMAAAILAQGDDRSQSVRTAAADLFAAAVSKSPEELAIARDWTSLEIMPKVQYHVAAGAQALARAGNVQEDEPRLLAAMGFLDQSGDYTSDAYKPTKRRLAAALARLLGGADARPLIMRYRDETAKPSRGTDRLAVDQFPAHTNYLIAEGLLLAILRTGDPAAKSFVQREWQPGMAAELHDYFKRVDPDYLRRVYEAWRAAKPSDTPQGLDRVLTPFAVADFGDKSDALKLYGQLSTGWNRVVENSTAALYDRALGDLVVRTGAFDDLADTVRKTLKEGLSSELSFHRLMAAVHVASAAGDETHLPMLERLIRINPQSTADVHFLHEMTQHEAAEGWARIVHREGLTKEYLTQPRATAAGEPAPPVLQAWLADTNPFINIAALETLRLFISEPEPPRPAGPARPSGPARALDAQTLLYEGPAAVPGRRFGGAYLNVLDPANEATRFELHRMPDWQRALAEEWARRFGALLTRLLGAPFTAQARVYAAGGDSQVVWVLRQALGAIVDEDRVAAAAETLAGLIIVAGKPAPERATALAGLGWPVDEADALLTLIGRLDDAFAAMGLDARALKPQEDPTGATEASDDGAAVPELWLRFGTPRPSLSEPRRASPQEIAEARNRAHGRDFDVDPVTGRRLYDPRP